MQFQQSYLVLKYVYIAIVITLQPPLITLYSENKMSELATVTVAFQLKRIGYSW